jgi:hypothetical protein
MSVRKWEDFMPLPVGTWSINANGNVGSLAVGATSSGTFNGTVFGQPLSGFFDETDQEFSFIRVTSPDVSTFEVYHGTLFSFSPTVGTVVFTLGGTFRNYPPAGAVSPFEWSAQMSQKLKEKEGKDGKDKEQSKDTKDLKDRKDNKEGGKDIEKHPKDKELELASQSAATDAGATVEQLAQRLTAVEQALAVGQAFISSSERPVVGAQATAERKPD